MISSDYDAHSHGGVADCPRRMLTLSAMRRLLVIVTVLALAACGDRYEQELKSARSWSVTALVVARCWEERALSDAYARRVLEKAAEELGKGPLPDAAEPVDELREAVARGDREAVRRLLAELSPR